MVEPHLPNISPTSRESKIMFEFAPKRSPRLFPQPKTKLEALSVIVRNPGNTVIEQTTRLSQPVIRVEASNVNTACTLYECQTERLLELATASPQQTLRQPKQGLKYWSFGLARFRKRLPSSNSGRDMVNIEWNKADQAYTLRSAVTLLVDRQELFDFFSDAFQLEQITPPWLHFHVTTAAPIDIEAGTLIDYKLKLHGFPIKWRTEISTWDPPFSFTDRQLKGPYYLWEHFHTFEEVEGGTLVSDEVNYRAIGGAIVHSLFVKNDLIKIFEYRRQRMIELFTDSASQT